MRSHACAPHVHHVCMHAACTLYTTARGLPLTGPPLTLPPTPALSLPLWLPMESREKQLREVHQLGARSGVLIRGAISHASRMHIACFSHAPQPNPNPNLTSLAGVLPLSACAQRSLIFRGDVLLEIDGHKIADDGTFAVGQQERLSFQHLIHLKYAGEPVALRLLRGGESCTSTCPSTRRRWLGLWLGLGLGLGLRGAARRVPVNPRRTSCLLTQPQP